MQLVSEFSHKSVWLTKQSVEASQAAAMPFHVPRTLPCIV